ncbi:hypothetical protein ACLBXM_05475 [Xanthobacteraceae bacterium A53D]
MRHLMILALLLAGVAPAMSAPPNAELASLPADVRAFIERRDGCDHFRGEEATDAERGAQINAALEKFCTGTDAQLARLRLAYAGNKAVLKALSVYERNVEGKAAR